MNIFSQKSALIQPKTSPPKFGNVWRNSRCENAFAAIFSTPKMRVDSSRNAHVQDSLTSESKTAARLSRRQQAKEKGKTLCLPAPRPRDRLHLRANSGRRIPEVSGGASRRARGCAAPLIPQICASVPRRSYYRFRYRKET